MTTILERFRELSKIEASDLGYSDTNIQDNLYPPCLAVYNRIMDEEFEIEDDTTSDILVDEAVANLCCWYAYREKYLKRVGNYKPIHEFYYQEALKIMEGIDPSKIYTDRGSLVKMPRFEQRGKPPYIVVKGSGS